jgi:Citrate synthase, C-terminal domain
MYHILHRWYPPLVHLPFDLTCSSFFRQLYVSCHGCYMIVARICGPVFDPTNNSISQVPLLPTRTNGVNEQYLTLSIVHWIAMASFVRGSLRTVIRKYGCIPKNYVRCASTASLKDTIREIIPEKTELFKQLRTQHGQKSLGEVTVEASMGGMRGLKAMLWEGSVLDPDEGIRFHGMTIPDCQKQLPKGKTGTEMLPEAMFWLLLTGKVPTEEQVRGLSKELAERVLNSPTKPDLRGVENVKLHPMVRLSTGVLALSDQSEFQKAYFKGVNKADYWESSIVRRNDANKSV